MRVPRWLSLGGASRLSAPAQGEAHRLMVSAEQLGVKNMGCPREATLPPSPQGPCQFFLLLSLYFFSRIGLNYKAGRCPILRYFSWGLGLLLTAAAAGLSVGEQQKHSQPRIGREERPCRIRCHCLSLS